MGEGRLEFSNALAGVLEFTYRLKHVGQAVLRSSLTCYSCMPHAYIGRTDGHLAYRFKHWMTYSKSQIPHEPKLVLRINLRSINQANTPCNFGHCVSGILTRRQGRVRVREGERERERERREPLFWGTHTVYILAAFLALVYFALNAIQVALRSLIQHDYNYSK